MTYKLGNKSLKTLEGVHKDLVAVVKRAIEISTQDFTVIEGLRTKARQEDLLRQKKTQTMNSRHLTGHAVDIAPWVNDTISWDWKYFYPVRDAMFQAAKELGVDLEWGGNWNTFKDGPHYQLTWKGYPK